MLIISLNINDFGGTDEHLAKYKKINCFGKECFDWAHGERFLKCILLSG